MKNEKKIAGAASELMYNDPRRRFISGITIEEHDLRFWMFNRSHIAVSQGVDFHKVRCIRSISQMALITVSRILTTW